MRRGRPASKYNVRFWQTLPHSTRRPIGVVLENIDQWTKKGFVAIAHDPIEDEILSEAVAKLPAYMKELGYYLADSENEANMARDEFELMKAKKEKGIIETDVPVSVAERTVAVDDELVLKKDVWRKAQHNYKVLKVQYDSTDRVFDGFRSRLVTVRKDVRAGE